MAAVELATAYVTLAVDSSKIGKQIGKGFAGSDKIAARSGKSMGASMRKAFSASKPIDVDAATKKLESAQDRLALHTERSASKQRKAQETVAAARQRAADVASKSSEKVASAQEKVEVAEESLARTTAQTARDQASAKRRVELAQAKYNETVSEYGAESTQALGAANRLADAEDRLAKTTADGAAKQEQAKRKLADAQAEYSKAVKESGEGSEAARKAANNLSVAEQQLEAASLEAANGHEKLSAEVTEAKTALDQAQRSSTGLSAAWGKAKDFGADYKGMGQRLNAAIGPKVWTGIKWGAIGAAGAVTAALGGALVKGWGRLTAIENAEAKLTGLGHSGEEVATIMDDALAAVKGTSYGLDEAAGLAGTLVASGIEPGKELESTLALVSDSATIAGRELGDMGLIWSSVAAKGKLQGDDAMQLLSAGVPIWQMVADVMGVTAAEAQELGSKGQVSFDIFRQAMEQGVGGAAQDAGKTTQGAFKNMGAAMSRFGAAVLEDIYPLIGPVFGKIGDLFDYLADVAGPAMGGIVDQITPFVTGIGDVWDLLTTGDFTGSIFGFEEDSAFVDFLLTLRDAAITLYDKALQPLGQWFAKHWKPIAAAIGGVVAYLGGAMLVAAISAIGAAIGSLSIPVTAIGAAIAAVAGGLAYFFTQTETGQKIIGKVFTAMQSAAGAAAAFFTGTVWPALLTGWEVLKTVVNAVWNRAIKPIFTALASLVMQVWEGVIGPAFEQFAGYLQGTFMPIIQRLWTDYFQPVFLAIGAIAVWLWNNAIKPVVSLITAYWTKVLGPVIVWLWKNVVSPAFSAIGAIIAFTWNSIIFPALDAMKWLITKVIGPAVLWLWRNVFKPAWEGIKLAVAIAITAINLYINALKWYFTQVIAPAAMWLWNKIMKPVWAGIKAAISAVVTWFRDTAWPVLQRVIGFIQSRFQALRNALDQVWSFIKAKVILPVVVWFRDTAWPIMSRVISWIRAGFNRLRDAIKSAWNFIKDKAIKPVVDWISDKVSPKLTGFTDAITEAFNTLKDNVLKAWDGIKSGMKKPINGVINIYNEHIAGNFNKVAKTLGLDKKYRLATMSTFHTGGYTGPGPKYKEAGVVHADEYVIRKESQRDVARRAPGFLDALNRHGARALGYAAGGLVKLGSPFRGSYPRGDGFGARGGRHKGIDWPIPSGTALIAVAPGTANRTRNPSAGNKLELRLGDGLTAGYHHLSRFGIGDGASATRGQTVGYVGSTGRSSGPHLHFSLKRDGRYVDPAPYLSGGGSAGSGSGDSWWNPFDGLWSTIKSKVANAAGDTIIGGILSKTVENLVGGVGDWVTNKIGSSMDGLAQVGESVKSGAGYARFLPVATQALSMTGNMSAGNLSALMRRMNQESGYNPRAINSWDTNAKAGNASRGLMQVIPPTFRAYRDGRAPNDIWDPLANILASIHYTKARYGSLTRGWNRKGGYSSGGLVTPFLHDNGGWHDAGAMSLNLTRKPEAVLTDAQWATMSRLAGQNLASQAAVQIGEVHGYSAEEVAEKIEKRRRRQEALYVR